MKKRLTTKEFIENAKKVHGNKYDYSKVNYVNAKTKVCIICPKHGEFWQTPDKHLRGHGCQKCHPLRKKTTEEFINEAKLVHGDKYDYSKTEYNGANKKVCITCPEHGDFMVFANLHLNGCGCKQCYLKKRRTTTEEFIKLSKEMYGDKFIYDKTDLDKRDENGKVIITCKKHGDLKVNPSLHLAGKNECRKCKGRFYMTKNEFIEEAKKIHGDKYDYSMVEYKNMNTKIKIICKEHGVFYQKPSKHLLGQGCPICKESTMENEIAIFLTKNKINFEREKTFDWLKYKQNLFLDFYLPEQKIGIECQGIQHYEPVDYFGGKEAFEKQKNKDAKKRILCEEHGIKVIYYTNIPEYKKITKTHLLTNIRK